MEVKTLMCPSCSSVLDCENGIDTLYCKYCGHKILLDGQSDAAYAAKVRIKEMEHEEKVQAKSFEHEEVLREKNIEHEKYKIKEEKKSDKRTFLMFACFLAVLFMILGIMSFNENRAEKKLEKELQTIVDEIMIDIENEDFAEAYIKANSLYWDTELSSDGEKKWNSIRKEIIKQIEEAEIKATGSSTNSTKEDEKSFWDIFS